NIESAAINILHTVKSNDDGLFAITELPPALYKLKIEGVAIQTPIDLSLGAIKQIDIVIKGNIGDGKVEIKFNNFANTSARATNIDRASKALLPLNIFNYLDLTYISPRVTLDRLRFCAGGSATSKISVNGQSPRFIAVAVNGFDILDKSSGAVR